MDLMLKLIPLTPKISVCLVQISLRSPCGEGLFIILRHSRIKTDVRFVKFVNNIIC